jgi:hypothetical protein
VGTASLRGSMVHPRGGFAFWRVLLWATAAILLAGGLVPTTAAAPAGTAVPLPSAPPHPSIGFAGLENEAVTWNGVNISQASDPGSAFSVGTGATVGLVFSFTDLGGPNVTARLQAFYFGAALSSNTVPAPVAPTGHGTGTMNWSFGDFTYVLQGLYHLTASLVYANNGTVAWSESFWINEQAPYRIVSGFTIFLLALGAAELYGIASTGRRNRRRRAPPQSWQGPTPGTAPPPPGSTPAPPPAAPTDSSPPPMPSPPSEGGDS